MIRFTLMVFDLTNESSLFSPRQRIISEAEEKEFIFPLVKKRGAII